MESEWRTGIFWREIVRDPIRQHGMTRKPLDVSQLHSQAWQVCMCVTNGLALAWQIYPQSEGVSLR